MTSGRWHPSSCRGCDAKASDDVHISATGLCPECGDARLRENVTGLKTMSGEVARRWRHGMAACVGGVLLDDARDEA